jgi:hypothetical protein
MPISKFNLSLTHSWDNPNFGVEVLVKVNIQEIWEMKVAFYLFALWCNTEAQNAKLICLVEERGTQIFLESI